MKLGKLKMRRVSWWDQPSHPWLMLTCSGPKNAYDIGIDGSRDEVTIYLGLWAFEISRARA